MILEPLYNNVLVEKDEEISESRGGLIIPDTSKEKPMTGTVLAIGPGSIHEQTGTITPTTVKVGDKVLFGKYAGQEIKIDNNTRVILKETEILGILR